MAARKNLGAMVVKLEADSKQMRKELRLVEGRVAKSSKRMISSFGKVSESTRFLRGALGKIGLGIGAIVGAAIAGGVALKRMVEPALDLADSLDKTSEKLGVTTDFLQKTRFAAEQTGIKISTLEMAMQRFTRRSAEAARGTGEAKDAIAELGLTLKDANGNLRSTESLFRDAMAALALVDSPAERLRLAFKLFDSEGAVLVNLASGFDRLAASAQGAGQVLDKETIAQAVKAKDELTLLGTRIKLQLIPALVDLAEPLTGLTKLFARFTQWVANSWATMRDFLNMDPKNLLETRDRLKEIVEELRDLEVAAARGARGIAKVGLRNIESRIAKLKAERVSLEKQLAEQLKLTKPREFSTADIELGSVALSVDSEAADGAVEALGRIEDATVDVQDANKTMHEQMTQNLERWRQQASDEFANFVVAGEGSFKRLAQSFQRDLISQIVNNALTSGLSSLFGGLQAPTVGVPAVSPILYAAHGGPVPKGHPVVVGEKGPEIIVPRVPAMVIPNSRIGKGSGSAIAGGDVTVTVNNFTDAQASVSERQTGGGDRVIEVFVKKVTEQNVASGGHDRAFQTRFGLRPVGRPGA